MIIHKFFFLFRRIHHIFWSNIPSFGIGITWFKILNELSPHITNSRITNYIYENKHKQILKYIEKKYRKDIEIIIKEISTLTPQQPEEFCIWQCWWQGAEKLKDITKLCTQSVKINCNEIPIKFITFENYENFITLPYAILEKHKKGIISLTELSDILRMNLLWKRGGLWIDTTILVNQRIDKEIELATFYTCPEECKDKRFVSEYKWNTSIIGGKQNLHLFAFVSKMFERYWEKENKLIDYYLLDYFIALGYKYVPAIKREIDNIPHNNPQKHNLQFFLNTPYKEKIWKELTNKTYIFKLSRKSSEPYVKYTRKKELTFYGYLYQKYNI